MSHTRDTPGELRWLAEELAARLSQVLESMTERQYSAAWRVIDGPGADFEALSWWEHRASGAVPSSLWIGASSGTCAALGGRVLTAAGVDADQETSLATFPELISQALSAVGQSLTTKLGREATFGAGSGCAADSVIAPAGTPIAVSLSSDGEDAGTVVCKIAKPILQVLHESAGVETAAVAVPERGASPTLHVPDQQATAVPPTLDLILDVEMPVSVSFGRTQLQIRDVMKLASGSIVELSRSVSEPVDVIVNNCVIARGEVVVIEGNYGVRIDHIISPQDRLRTLR